MKYEVVFWDIDGTLYDPLINCPKWEEELPEKSDLDGINISHLKFWMPYPGIKELLKKIPKNIQGIISNGYDLNQKNKILLLGVEDYFNPKLIFTSGGEAERLLSSGYRKINGKKHIWAIDNMMEVTQKPGEYIFKRALQISGIKAENAIMIGNSWTDIYGAQKTGMNSIYISGTEKNEEANPVLDGKIIPKAIVRKGDIPALERLLL